MSVEYYRVLFYHLIRMLDLQSDEFKACKAIQQTIPMSCGKTTIGN